MTTLSAEPLPAAAAVRLTVGAPGGAFVIVASPQGRTPYEVRRPADAQGLTVTDHEAPLRIPITYRVEAPGGVAQVTTEVLRTGAVLSSALVPGSAIGVRILTDAPHDWEARSAYFAVIDRDDPLVTVAPMLYRSGEWSLYLSGNSDRRALLNLTRSGHPLMLRTSHPEQVDDATVLPLRVTIDPHADNTGGRLARLTYQVVTTDLGPFPGREDWTYGDVLTGHTDYAAVLESFATYQALRIGTPLPPDPAPQPLTWGVVT